MTIDVIFVLFVLLFFNFYFFKKTWCARKSLANLRLKKYIVFFVLLLHKHYNDDYNDAVPKLYY